MELDWTTLYDYMSISSRQEIRSKINKFYESFYPLKFKKSGRKTCKLESIERAGLLGLIASYIQEVLFTLEIYLEAEYFLSSGQVKDNVKLSKMFVEIEKKNLQVTLELEKIVFVITEAFRVFNSSNEDKFKEKQFLEIKIICSLNRLFEFYYSIYNMRNQLEVQSYERLQNCLRLFAFKVCQKSKNHIKLFPQIGEILVQILNFFTSQTREDFNFHSHLTESSSHKYRTYPQRTRKLITVIPNKQKAILVNLSDEAFYKYLSRSGLTIPRDPVENYFRCQQEINSIIADEENFVKSILIPQQYRGKKQWKEKTMQQLVNLSARNRQPSSNHLLAARNFTLSEDFPLNL